MDLQSACRSLLPGSRKRPISRRGRSCRRRAFQGSIINSNDYNKTLKKVDDFYSNYLNLRKELNKIDGDKNIINSYLANSLILKITELNYKDYRKYLKKLHEDKVFDLILDDTPARKMKKIMLKISPKLYYRRFQW